MQVWKWAALGTLAGITMTASGWAQAATPDQSQNHLGFVFETDAEFGGDNVVKVFYTNGATQTIRAGQGVSLALGAHYQLASLPLDFAATVGYKYVTTAASNANINIGRVVIKGTGTYELPQKFWMAAGPVWHVGTRLNGDGFVPDIDFGDSVGGTVGVGWRWFGISYTNIRYSSPLTGGINGSNVGLNFILKL